MTKLFTVDDGVAAAFSYHYGDTAESGKEEPRWQKDWTTERTEWLLELLPYGDAGATKL